MIIHSDEYWYELLLMKDPASGALTSIEKSIIIEKSMQEAELQKERIETRFGKQDFKGYLSQFGFHLEEEYPEIMPAFLYMGLWVPEERNIYLNNPVISLLEDYLKTNVPKATEQIQKLREIVVFHELYHGIEELTAGIYTRNVKVQKRFLGVFPYQQRIEAASEIGAIHFSKIMSKAAFSPYLYTQYLAAAANMKLEVENER